jgi:replicative superfamily II helicase
LLKELRRGCDALHDHDREHRIGQNTPDLNNRDAPMDRWQEIAISELTSSRDNAMIVAPTSAGKGRVGRSVLQHDLQQAPNGSTSLWLTPLRALALSESTQLNEIANRCGQRKEVLSMTPERAMLWIRRSQLTDVSQLCCVVADEAHSIGDATRGATLDFVLTLLLFASSVCSSGPRIVLLSATVGNCNSMARWLNARLFATNVRPVPLETHFVCAGSDRIVNGVGTSHPELSDDVNSCSVTTNAWECLVQLVGETLMLESEANSIQSSVLVFAKSRASAESCAESLVHQLSFDETGARSKLVSYMQAETEGNANITVVSCCKRGVGVHHAGLLDAERNAVENAFLNGTLAVLTTTTTLAAGVNLPARVVIVTGYDPDEISCFTLRQMCGRAGRYGQASKGKAYFIVPHESKRFSQLASATQKRCASFFANHPLVGCQSGLMPCVRDDSQAREGGVTFRPHR